jgi:hypothetical protein
LGYNAFSSLMPQYYFLYIIILQNIIKFIRKILYLFNNLSKLLNSDCSIIITFISYSFDTGIRSNCSLTNIYEATIHVNSYHKFFIYFLMLTHHVIAKLFEVITVSPATYLLILKNVNFPTYKCLGSQFQSCLIKPFIIKYLFDSIAVYSFCICPQAMPEKHNNQ